MQSYLTAAVSASLELRARVLRSACADCLLRPNLVYKSSSQPDAVGVDESCEHLLGSSAASTAF